VSGEVALCLGCGGVSPGDVPKVLRQLGGVMFKGQNVHSRTSVSLVLCLFSPHERQFGLVFVFCVLKVTLKKVIIFPTVSRNEEFCSSQ